MPTVVIVDGFRVVVYPLDHTPPHIHVIKAGEFVRLRLDDLRTMGDETLRPTDVSKAQAIVAAHREQCWETWRRYHG